MSMVDFNKAYARGEYFVYRNGDRQELGMVKRRIDDETYACYYSMGDTAAHTPVDHMHRLENGMFSPASRILFCDLAKCLPIAMPVSVISDSGSAVDCILGDVPSYYEHMRVHRISFDYERMRLRIEGTHA